MSLAEASLSINRAAGAELVVTIRFDRDRCRHPFPHVSSRCVVDEQGEEIRAAVVTSRVHLDLALVDQREVEVGDDLAFAGAQRLADDLA